MSKRRSTFVLLAAVLGVVGLLAPAASAGGPPDQTFTDVPPSNPFFEHIEWGAAEGIVEGYPDGTFRPIQNVSRQAMAAFLYRLQGSPEPPEEILEQVFSDVPEDHPFFIEIFYLHAAGISEGYEDGTFRPSATITRQALAQFIYGFLMSPPLPPEIPQHFTDVTPTHPFYAAIELVHDLEIAEGYEDGTFRPAALVTRQVAATMVHRTFIALNSMETMGASAPGWTA
jgi:hypothetical protein